MRKIFAVIVAIIMVLSVYSLLQSDIPHENKNIQSQNIIDLQKGNITMTGDVKANFNGYKIGSNNFISPWGPNDIIKGIYLAYNLSDLFIGINENISGNSLVVYITNVSGSIYGTENISNMNLWSRGISFTEPMDYFAAVYFNGLNSNPQSDDAFSINSYLNQDPVANEINSTFVFGPSHNTTEIKIPWSGMFPDGFSGKLSFGISAFVIGDSGPWVGSGIPHFQVGKYNDGNQNSFLINNTVNVSIKELNVKATPSYKDYPSYLLLNNFNNNIIWVSTGIHDSYLSYPYSNYDFSIHRIQTDLGRFPLKVYFSYGLPSQTSKLDKNNTILVNTTLSKTYLFDVPYSNQIDALQLANHTITDQFQFTGNFLYNISKNSLYISTNPNIVIHYNNSKVSAIKDSTGLLVIITSNPGRSGIGISFGNVTHWNVKSELSLNNKRIEQWLNRPVTPELSGNLLREYYISLLLIKDDQNPITGEITASPSPVYLYTWARDGSFSAISLEEAGHISSALHYWKWMASEQGIATQNGTWQTRFNFWNSNVSLNWIYPEYDSIGEFQIGIYDLYKVTDNYSMIKPFISTIRNSLDFEMKSIEKLGLIPEDHSIWEQQYGYWFWTQAIDEVGMKYSFNLLFYGNMSYNLELHKNINILQNNIIKYFYIDGYFAQYITPIESQYPGNGTPEISYLMNNTMDASQILPVALGFINPDSYFANSIVNTVYSFLDNGKVGGLPRYYNDLYHYTEYGGYLQSSGPSPPWIVTTMFMGIYDEKIGNMFGAKSILEWAVNHTQNGLLPEAIDPNFGTVIASTSPLTWSSAMYIQVALGYKAYELNCIYGY